MGSVPSYYCTDALSCTKLAGWGQLADVMTAGLMGTSLKKRKRPEAAAKQKKRGRDCCQTGSDAKALMLLHSESPLLRRPAFNSALEPLAGPRAGGKRKADVIAPRNAGSVASAAPIRGLERLRRGRVAYKGKLRQH